MAHEPGTRYAYCTAGMNLVGAALHAATGEHIFDLFERYTHDRWISGSTTGIWPQITKAIWVAASTCVPVIWRKSVNFI